MSSRRKAVDCVVVKLDLNGSRSMPHARRQDAQDLLVSMASVIKKSGRCMKTGMCCGDGIEAICKDSEKAEWVVMLCIAALGGLKFSMGVGAGKWTIFGVGDVNAQDGPVFWEAEAMLKDAKSASSPHAIGVSDSLDSQFASRVLGFMDSVRKMTAKELFDKLFYEILKREEEEQGDWHDKALDDFWNMKGAFRRTCGLS